jgi:Ca2+:H+ antiporter
MMLHHLEESNSNSKEKNLESPNDHGSTEDGAVAEPKMPLWTRFIRTFKLILFDSWVNILLVFVPIGIAVKIAGLSPVIVFAMNAIAIIPLAGMLAFATESVASKLGDTIGALMNVTFGNAVELIIFIIALVKNEITIVQASLLGSILANLLLILGMSFLIGGLRFREQIYNSTVTQMSACLLSLAVISLILPTAFHESFSDKNVADAAVLQVSRGCSVILLLVYALYLVFQLKSHAYMYESTPQHIIDEESHPGVLAEILNSSSSSDSSSTDSDTSSSSSGSNRTAKRIRRVLHRARGRRSSASSKDKPNFVASPATSIAIPDSAEGTASPSPEAPRSIAENMELDAIVSGDEADLEGEGGLRMQQKNVQFPGLDVPGKKERRRQQRKSRNAPSNPELGPDSHRDFSPGAEASSSKESESIAAQIQSAPDPSGSNIEQTKKRLLNMQAISATLRPVIPRAFTTAQTTTAANTAANAGSPAPAPITPRPKTGLRRTNSLPDRLNTIQQVQSAPSMPFPSGAYPLVRHHTTVSQVSIDSNEVVDKRHISRTAAIILLLVSTGLVAICAEFMVGSIDYLVSNSPLSEAFVGLILLPIVGNAAEHVTAVTVAAKNKMDLAIGVAVGSSIQIALFVTPLIVILGWCMDRDMTLYFNLFETVCLFASAFIVNFLVLDGRSNYLEGALLMAAYILIA